MPTEPPHAAGERVVAQESPFDAGEVAAAARHQDPGLPPETAALLAGQAWGHLRDLGALDAPALARALLVGNTGIGATPCNAVATAAVAFCAAHGVHP